MQLKTTIRYLIILFTTIVVTITFSPSSSAQLPLTSYIPNIDETLPETPMWDLNKARPCGKYWCSNIYFYGNQMFNRDTITVALARDLTKPAREVAIDVEQRAKFIQKIFKQIFENIQQSDQLGKVEAKNWRFWLLDRQKPVHPLTPIVETGTENEQTVIYIAAKPELGLSQQSIITVTEVDAKANGTTLRKLAESWRLEIKESLSEAIWGLEMDSQHPLLRIQIILIFTGGALVLFFIIEKIKEITKTWKKILSQELKDIQASLAVNPEGKPKDTKNSEINQSLTQEESIKVKNTTIQRLLFRSLNQSRKVIADSISFSSKFLPIQLRQKQNLVRQQINISELITSLLRLSEFALIFSAIASIVFTYRETRFLFNLFFTQAIILPIIWIVMVVMDKVVDFWIDYALNKWAQERQTINPNSNRPSLRVNTYSLALKGATTFLFTLISIFLSFAVIGLKPTVLASAGALAVVFAFLSRNLLEDMLNGILILATDRYAVGDVIEINGLNGCVESMDLYATSLRNLDGQLTVIPNGQISTVINMTKNWSQVNFTIDIAWNNNIGEVMMILQSTADQMYEEEEWREKMISSADILGIEHITHEGIMIRLTIPTQPSMHWAVGREFRWRVKEAFDSASITIGIPQREIWHHNHAHITANSNSDHHHYQQSSLSSHR